MSGSWDGARRDGDARREREGCKRRCGVRGGRSTSAAAEAGSRRTGTPIRVMGGSAAHRDERHRRLGGPAARPGGRVRAPRGQTRCAGRPPSRRAPAAAEKVRACTNWIFELHGRRLTARRAACASGQAAWHCPRACSFRMRLSAPVGPSALAARQLPGSRRQSSARQTNLHLVVDAHARSSPAARHGLVIRDELASDAASGRIGRC